MRIYGIWGIRICVVETRIQLSRRKQCEPGQRSVHIVCMVDLDAQEPGTLDKAHVIDSLSASLSDAGGARKSSDTVSVRVSHGVHVAVRPRSIHCHLHGLHHCPCPGQRAPSWLEVVFLLAKGCAGGRAMMASVC